MADFPCPVAHAARQWPDRPALIFEGGAWTYREYYRLTRFMANRLEELGLRRGDYLACLIDNSPWFAVLLAAATRIGVVLCPLSLRSPQTDIIERLSAIPASHLIAETPVADAGTATIGLAELVKDARAAIDPDPHDDVLHIESDQPVTVVFTSGSAGKPKGVLHTFGNHFYNALGSNENILFGEGDRWLLALPLYHVGGIGILYRAVLGGGTVVFRNPAKGLADQIIADSVTHLSLVYTQLVRAMDSDDDVARMSGQLKTILLGGSGWPESTVYLAVQQGLPIRTTYGLTEMASQVTTTAESDLPGRLRSSGRALKYRKVTIADDDEIYVSGETLCRGYLGSDGTVEQVIDDSGWFHTGDIGAIDDDGYLYVKGRKDNMFISGGENIQPEEIESALYRIQGVERALVVPVTHEEFGRRPVAFVKMTIDIEMNADALTKKLGESLPRFKIPDFILPWPDSVSDESKPSRPALAALARRHIDSIQD